MGTRLENVVYAPEMWNIIMDNKLSTSCPIFSSIILGVGEIGLNRNSVSSLPIHVKSMYINGFANHTGLYE